MYKIQDFKTKKTITPKGFVFTGESNPWEIVMDLAQIKSRINIDYFKKSPPYESKYLPLMPVKDYSQFVSLGEGATPLVQSSSIEKEFGAEIYFKLENQNPTDSFKDRGSAIELTIAKEIGAKAITVASTGNMAASCSCYSARAKIPCYVFVPEGTPQSKLAQVIAFGGKIIQVRGSYGEAAILAEKIARKLNYYLAGDYAFRVEGQKTAAFELIDQMLFDLPDYIVIPIGCGTNIAAYYKGFLEYKELGFTTKIPQLIGVQAEGAASVVSAFEKSSHEPEKLDKAETIAGAIRINNPLDGVKALDAIYKSKGKAIKVNDEEMLNSQYQLAKDEGIFAEASSAATLAALNKIKDSLLGKKIVCIITGGGLKDPTPILKIAKTAPTIDPNIDDFMSIQNSL